MSNMGFGNSNFHSAKKKKVSLDAHELQMQDINSSRRPEPVSAPLPNSIVNLFGSILARCEIRIACWNAISMQAAIPMMEEFYQVRLLLRELL